MKVELIETRTLDGTAGTSTVRLLEGKSGTRKKRKRKAGVTTEQVADFLTGFAIVLEGKKKTREVEDDDKTVEPSNEDDEDTKEEEDEDNDERSESEDDTDVYEPDDDDDDEQEEEEDDEDEDDRKAVNEQIRRSGVANFLLG
jgi:hypothetical protein